MCYSPLSYLLSRNSFFVKSHLSFQFFHTNPAVKNQHVAQEKHDEEEERIMGTNPSLSEAGFFVI